MSLRGMRTQFDCQARQRDPFSRRPSRRARKAGKSRQPDHSDGVLFVSSGMRTQFDRPVAKATFIPAEGQFAGRCAARSIPPARQAFAARSIQLSVLLAYLTCSRRLRSYPDCSLKRSVSPWTLCIMSQTILCPSSITAMARAVSKVELPQPAHRACSGAEPAGAGATDNPQHRAKRQRGRQRWFTRAMACTRP